MRIYAETSRLRNSSDNHQWCCDLGESKREELATCFKWLCDLKWPETSLVTVEVSAKTFYQSSTKSLRFWAGKIGELDRGRRYETFATNFAWNGRRTTMKPSVKVPASQRERERELSSFKNLTLERLRLCHCISAYHNFFVLTMNWTCRLFTNSYSWALCNGTT